MKKLFFLMTLAAAVTTACRKEAAPESDDHQAQKTSLTVRVDDSMETKATDIKGDAEDEKKMNTIQVFVFNGEDIDGYGTATGTSSLTLGCTVGSRDVYALVNAPDLSSVSSRTGLLGQISELGNDIGNMEMIGSKPVDIKADTPPVNIEAERFAARVVVKKVTNALTSLALQKQEFTIQSMHLNNVAGDVDYGVTESYQPKIWYNQAAYKSDSNSPGSMTYDGIASVVGAGLSYDEVHYFYAYPNKAPHSSALDWSPRATMLVLKIRIGETLYNYPIRLPALESNRSYEIDEIRITRPGNKDDGIAGGTDEQEPVQGKDCTFTVSVKGWDPITVTEGTTI